MRNGVIMCGPKSEKGHPSTDWIGDNSEHDRDGARHLQQRCKGGAGMGQDYVRAERNQFRGMRAHGLGITAAPSVID